MHRVAPLLFWLVGACTAANPSTEPLPVASPRDVLPPGVDAATVRSDLLATAQARFGAASVQRAMAAPTHLIVKRFAGMAPPPPPGAGPDWRAPTPTALLIRDGSSWLVAEREGWRPAKAETVEELNTLLADPRLWSEPFYTPPCPDFGASLLLLKMPAKAEKLSNSLCSSHSARVVEAALRA